MSTEWIKRKRLDWPEKSLERHLLVNYPGCKTAVEAVKEILKLKNQIKEIEEKEPKKEEKKVDDFEW